MDDNTIIYTVYSPSTNRDRLYLADVVAAPFALNRNTAWNANGYITTSASTRIRNVRVGDAYSGYAYYGDGNQSSNPNMYVVNLATAAETLLGNAGTLTGTGSFGVWTVLERGGYLYVQTTDNARSDYDYTPHAAEPRNQLYWDSVNSRTGTCTLHSAAFTYCPSCQPSSSAD